MIERKNPTIIRFLSYLITLIIILTIVVVFLSMLNDNPFNVIISIGEGAFGSFARTYRTLLIFVPIALSCAALSVTFRSGMWNIGIEGQIILGAIGASMIARSIIGESQFSPLVSLSAGVLFGAIWGLISGILRTTSNVHEIFAGLGLNFVGAGLVIYLIIGPWKRIGVASTSGTDIFPQTAWLPDIGNGLPLPALLIVGVLYLFLYGMFRWSVFGTILKAMGSNPDAAPRYYINADKYIIYSFGLAGAIAGLAGGIQAISFYHKLVPSISGGFGFLGILIVLASSQKLHTSLIVSFLFSGMISAGPLLQIEYDIHSSVPWLLQAFVIAAWVFISYSSLHIKSAYFIRGLTNKITTNLLGLIK